MPVNYALINWLNVIAEFQPGLFREPIGDSLTILNVTSGAVVNFTGDING
jgi:hypothetical protein